MKTTFNLLWYNTRPFYMGIYDAKNKRIVETFKWEQCTHADETDDEQSFFDSDTWYKIQKGEYVTFYATPDGDDIVVYDDAPVKDEILKLIATSNQEPFYLPNAIFYNGKHFFIGVYDPKTKKIIKTCPYEKTTRDKDPFDYHTTADLDEGKYIAFFPSIDNTDITLSVKNEKAKEDILTLITLEK